MRIRGRRVALLIAGALPLLADDIAQHRHVEQQQPSSSTTDDDEHDTPAAIVNGDEYDIRAAEFLHDDSLTRLPALPMEFFDAPPPSHVPIPRDSQQQQRGVYSEEKHRTEAEDAMDDNDAPLSIHHEEEIEGENDDLIVARSEAESRPPGDADAAGAATAGKEEDTTLSSSSEIESDATTIGTADNTTTTTSNAPEAYTALELQTSEAPESNTTLSETADTTAQSANETSGDFTAEALNETASANATKVEGDAGNVTAADTNVTNNATLAEDLPDLEAIGERIAVDYASKSAGALILEKSNNFKGTSNLLNADRDKYAISPCQEKKFVVISLSEDILVKQVKIGNYELYSSQVKEFQILGSQTLGNDWLDLGTYVAKPGSGMQSFDLKEPSWSRYLKFRFFSHYGDEHYCTISQIAVHGSTMVQGFHEHLEDELLENTEEAEALSVGNGSVAKNNEEASSIGNSGAALQDSAVTGSGGAAVGTDVSNITDGSANGTLDATNGLSKDGADASNDTSNTDVGAATASGAADSGEDQIEQIGGENDTQVNATRAACETDSNKDSRFLPVTRPGRNVSSLLPVASLGPSLQVFSSFLSRPGPWNTSNRKQACILTEEQDSITSVKLAPSSPSVRERLLTLYENMKSPDEAAGFGSSLEANQSEPTKQHLAQRIAAFIEESVPLGMRHNLVPSQDVEEGDFGKAAEKPSAVAEEIHSNGSDNDTKPSLDSMHDSDLALAKLLNKVPSVRCLKDLDFAAFKERIMSARKGSHDSGAGHGNEPMFKLLTDQIKALQFSLHVHDQFTKEAVLCYQKVMLDLVLELQTLRSDHESRLSRLEQDLQETKTVRWIFLLYQMLLGLPHLASLFVATGFTTYAIPMFSAWAPSWLPSMPNRMVDRLPLLPFSLPTSLIVAVDKIASLAGDEQVSGWLLTGFVVMMVFSFIYSLKQRLWPVVCERVQVLGALRYGIDRPKRPSWGRADSDPGVSGHTEPNKCREQRERDMTVPGSLSFSEVVCKVMGVQTPPKDALQSKRKIPLSPASVASVHACAEDASPDDEFKAQQEHHPRVNENGSQGLTSHIEEIEIPGVSDTHPWMEMGGCHDSPTNAESVDTNGLRDDQPRLDNANSSQDSAADVEEVDTAGSMSSDSAENSKMDDLQNTRRFEGRLGAGRSVSC